MGDDTLFTKKESDAFRKREPDIIRRLRILYVKKYFEEYTDEEHSASMSQIIEYLKKHDIIAERKSILSDIEALNEYGMEIQLDEKGKQRRLIEREFDVSEVKMLMDFVAASHSLSEAQSKALIKKIGSLVSSYQRLNRRLIIESSAKGTNKNVPYFLAQIHTAITNKKCIRFKYLQYNINKECIYKHNGKDYQVKPRHLLYENNNYYLLGYDGDNDKTYRVDRMDKVEIIDNPKNDYWRYSFDRIDLRSYRHSTFGMFSGPLESVTMTFKNEMIDTVIDKFGKDMEVMKVDPDHFRITVKIAISPQFFGWIFALGDKVMIDYPLSIAKQMKDMLKERHQAYREGHSGRIYTAK